MKFSAFLPTGLDQIDSAIIWLSGLTCTEENFITKAGAQKFLANGTTMIICPDTSPRGLGYAGEDDSYDFGTGAGFYVNATTEPYKKGYQMYDYITKDLVELLKDDFGVSNLAISGHSMGGHGALVIGLRNPGVFKSISAFSPITNPINSVWGKKALAGYLGNESEAWKEYDACELLKRGHKSKPNNGRSGLSDEFYPDQLLTETFEDVQS